jgi:hypothetical protein
LSFEQSANEALAVKYLCHAKCLPTAQLSLVCFCTVCCTVFCTVLYCVLYSVLYVLQVLLRTDDLEGVRKETELLLRGLAGLYCTVLSVLNYTVLYCTVIY